MLRRLIASLVLLAAFSLPAFADDWVATKLRGSAESLVEETWVPLKRGDVVSDDRLVRTLADSRLDLQRGAEVITLGPETQISIRDSAELVQTIVMQDFGTVEVEAEAKVVEHFTVRTKFMAAVVKGTHFIVTADEFGASVAVTRGLVAVEATESKHSTSVRAGYTASIGAAGAIRVSGTGPGPMPPVFDASGLQLPALPAIGGAGSATVGGDAGGSQQVAAAGGQGAALSLDQAQPAAAATPQAGITDWMPTAIGVLAGIMLGGFALLFRRFFT